MTPGISAEKAPQPTDELAGKITLGGIKKVITDYFDEPIEGFPQKRHTHSEILSALGCMVTLMADHIPSLSHTDIAKEVGIDQSSVSRAIGRTRRLAAEDPKLQAHLADLTRAAAGEPLTTTLSTWLDLVSEHYSIPNEAIASGQNPRDIEARRVHIHLLDMMTPLKHAAIARRTGIDRNNIKYALSWVAERRQNDKDFAQQLEELEKGRLPEMLREDDVIRQVVAHFGITREELLEARRKIRTTPRLFAKYILVKNLGYSRRETVRVVGGDPGVIDDQVAEFEEQLQSDPELQQQLDEILDPKNLEHEPAPQRLTKIICDFYGVTLEEIRGLNVVGRFTRPRRVVAYLLSRNLHLSAGEIKKQLHGTDKSINLARQNLENEIKENPQLAAELRYLAKAKTIKQSINERIFRRVAEATQLDYGAIIDAENPETMLARQMVMALMAERGHLTRPEVAPFFDLHDSSVRRAIRTVRLAETQNPLLAQQLEYVRQKVFTEKPGSFTFKVDPVHTLEAGDERLVVPDDKPIKVVVDDPPIEVVARTEEVEEDPATRRRIPPQVLRELTEAKEQKSENDQVPTVESPALEVDAEVVVDDRAPEPGEESSPPADTPSLATPATPEEADIPFTLANREQVEADNRALRAIYAAASGSQPAAPSPRPPTPRTAPGPPGRPRNPAIPVPPNDDDDVGRNVPGARPAARSVEDREAAIEKAIRRNATRMLASVLRLNVGASETFGNYDQLLELYGGDAGLAPPDADAAIKYLQPHILNPLRAIEGHGIAALSFPVGVEERLRARSSN